MTKKHFKLGDEVFFFDGTCWPEKIKINGIFEDHENFAIYITSKKHVVSGKDTIVIDSYLYATEEAVEAAINGHVAMLRSWLKPRPSTEPSISYAAKLNLE